MTKPTDDDLLTGAFHELRAEARESDRTPDFGAMMDEARRQAERRPALEVVAGGAGRSPARRFFRVGAWASAALAAGLAALLVIDRAPSGDDDFARLVTAYTSDAAGGRWSSPTDRLLEMPGIDLMRSVPAIGESLRGIDPSALRSSSSSPEEETL